jgi:hypothetical protein
MLKSGARFWAPVFSFFLSHAASAYVVDDASFALYEEFMMAGAGTGYLGSVGNVSTNPAGLAFIKDLDRYYTNLLIARFDSGDDTTIDDGVSVLPALVAKSFPLLAGVLEPYLSTQQFLVSTGSVTPTENYSFLLQANTIRAGLGWGRKSGDTAFGLGMYLSRESSISKVNFSSTDTMGFNNSSRQTLLAGLSLGMAQAFESWTWGLRFSIAPALISSRARTTGETYIFSNQQTYPINESNSDAQLRANYVIGGTTLRLTETLTLLTDVGWNPPLQGKDLDAEVDYQGSVDFKLGLKQDLEERRSLFYGISTNTKNVDSKSGSHEDVTINVSAGYKRPIKTSNTFYGLTYNQDKSGDGRAYILTLGSDFSL